MLLTLIWCACAHSPEPGTPSETRPPTPTTGSPTSERREAAAGDEGVGGLVAASLFQAVMGYDPGLSAAHPAVTRVSFFEALELANALSAREGLEPCYEVECDGAAMGGCAREGQPYCEDLRKCTTRRRPGACGYRLPDRGSGDGEVAIWLERDSATCSVGGRTRLSSPDTETTRRAPVRCALKAEYIGIALTLGGDTSPSPGRGGAEPSPP